MGYSAFSGLGSLGLPSWPQRFGGNTREKFGGATDIGGGFRDDLSCVAAQAQASIGES